MDERAKERDRGDAGGEELEVIWDQPQPRYPAPERPRDQAEQRPPKQKRSA